jgi:hypothetical protein
MGVEASQDSLSMEVLKHKQTKTTLLYGDAELVISCGNVTL